ncbi:hypothetical protein [Pectobacterium parmentieri]|uniref:hypothetical protein n=1 Tax=Pectobacterium parmentieri TaxID=1905730 RepID=UPI0018E1814E|nr:hypothetical protein [Pectobacterium parmentieri]QQA74587.1 hypothetical protein JBL47_14415 [Pectobacterium parmentieri]
MNNYSLSISTFRDSNDNIGYYVFDSFGVCIGYASSLELAHSLIINYIEHLIKIYNGSMNLLENIDHIKTKIHNDNKIEYVNDILRSFEEALINATTCIKKEEIEKFSFQLNNKLSTEFIFNTDDVTEIHRDMISKLLDEEIKNEEKEKIKKHILSYTKKYEDSTFMRDIIYIFQENKLNLINEKKNKI